MTEAFRKDTMRTMRKTMNRFCSILLIVALGVGFFAGVRATGDDMRDTASDYYIDYNAMDVKVLSTLGFSENDVAAVAAVDGVKQVYAGKYVDCLTLCHDNFLTRVFSLPQNPDSPETMNRLRVLEGQLPQAADECVIDEKIQYKYHFELGQTLSLGSADPTDDLENELEHTEYTIVGIVNSPMYLDMTRRGSTTVGDGSLDAYLYVLEENFTAKYYTELYVTAEGSGDLNCYTEEYDTLAAALKDALEPVGEARGELRMQEMADYLNEKIPEARDKIADAEEQLADAEQQLTDAANELADARKQIEDGEKELTDGRAELEKQKAAVSKANSEAAEWKRKHNALLGEDEKKKQEQEEKFANMEKELSELREAKRVSEFKAKFIAQGYDEVLAEDTAKAMADGDSAKVFANQQKFLDEYTKQVKADALKKTPKPTPGAGGGTGEMDYAKKIEEARTNGDFAAVAYYTRLQAEAEAQAKKE